MYAVSSAKAPSEDPGSPAKHTDDEAVEAKLRRWARSAPPRQVVSMRKRQNKMSLGSLANRLHAECGDRLPSPQDAAATISIAQPMEPLPELASFGILYHDVRMVSFAAPGPFVLRCVRVVLVVLRLHNSAQGFTLRAYVSTHV